MRLESPAQNGMWKMSCLVFLFSLSIKKAVLDNGTERKTDDPVSTPVLTISVIQTQTGHNVTLRCISHNGSLPINYTFFENNGKVSPVISKNVREPAEFHFTKISTREGGKYKCEARNSLPNSTKDSQHIPMALTECPSPSLSSKTSVITKGQNVSLLCSIKKNPSTVMKYTLFRDKKQMGTTDGKKEFAIFNLTISEAHDLGPYKCKVSCLKYSRDFNFTFANPVSTPVLTISVIQTQTGHNVTLRCISHNGSLPINYTFFENNGKVSPVISKNVREPAEFHFIKISTREGGKYKCEARNSLPNNTKDSQVLPMPSTAEDGCPLCLQLILPGLLLVLIITAVILACWIRPKCKARKALRATVPNSYGDTSMEVVEYGNIHRNQGKPERDDEPRNYADTPMDFAEYANVKIGTDHSQELYYATPRFQKVASGEHEARNGRVTECTYSELV